jgi:hypothetical protein
MEANKFQFRWKGLDVCSLPEESQNLKGTNGLDVCSFLPEESQNLKGDGSSSSSSSSTTMGLMFDLLLAGRESKC